MSPPYAKLAITILGFMFISMFPDAYEAELVHRLPGQPQVSFKQYAGYIPVGKRNDRALFYYFVEAEQNPSSKPLVLWLNGGPGCSSVGVGAFSENGPFQPRGNVLVRNHYSWIREANILYLETPAGVGFSYSNITSFYNGVNDKITARDNLVFLQRWLNKFPAYKTRDLYLTGESYAGHYIPQLAVLMLRFNKKQKIFNLKGVALGNPLLNFEKDFNARAEYLWSHGLISDKTYKSMVNICNYSRYVHEYYAGNGNVSAACWNVNAMVDGEVSIYISSYDVTLDVCRSSIDMQSRFLTTKTEEKNPDVCVEDESITYLNRGDVQTALNIDISAGVLSWETCSSKLHYDHQNLEISTVPLLGQLVKAGVRVLVYSGDQDSVIPLMSTRTLIYNIAIDLKLKSSAPYRVWFEEKQVAGWTQGYGNLLTFATVRGASHEVPFSQPGRSLVLFKSFLEGKSLPDS